MKKILVFILFASLISCTNSFRLSRYSSKEQEKIIKENFDELSDKFYILLEDKINESKRKKLEEKFTYLKNEIASVKTSGSSKHIKFLNDYYNLVNIKIQYLKDLK